jgi:hypothetical protein
MTIQEVFNELDCVLHVNKKWEIATAADEIFKVILPTKDDMASLKKIKNLELDNSKVVMYFEEWSSI